MPISPKNPNSTEYYKYLQSSPTEFVKCMWGLTPQEFKDAASKDLALSTHPRAWKGEWFSSFEKGKHITWQQYAILYCVEQAMRGKFSRRISIRSGHGIGKSFTISCLIIWFLFCFKNAQVPCTAPTSHQMHDVLWKEVSKWLRSMPKSIQKKFDWSRQYIRVKESPETWFARAKTSRRDNPEALAGIHADHVMFVIDEASGVADDIFKTAEGALTNNNIFMLMISNPTRLSGYFYDSHHSDKKNFESLHFSCTQSPIVDHQFVTRILEKYGEDSDEYRVRVLGEFPKEDSVDDAGYLSLLSSTDIQTRPTSVFLSGALLGVDPSGNGGDESVWVLRDFSHAEVVKREQKSTPKGGASITLSIMEQFGIEEQNVYIDSFGEGANWVQELALAGKRVQSINVGKEARDSKRFLNLRAEQFWKLKEWLRSGGELTEGADWEELMSIRYRAELSGKLKIMGKQEMKKKGYKSPNIADALMLTFGGEASFHSSNMAQSKKIGMKKIQRFCGD